ncbi:M48 family metalloprotease [Candidatus Micrarchaeota archaeon]|nr:M48 family metalloprotease [Candidatus Micrarchaeota archaeon]
MVRVALASILSLSLLGLFLFIISALVFWFGDLYGAFGLGGMLLLEAILFILVWRIGPKINDWMYGWLYGAKFLTEEEFIQRYPELSDFVFETCKNEKISAPRVAIIEDDNPQAFTYGSDYWNARLIFTRGITKLLNEDEQKAVIAHELGHIVHRDFIVMTLGAFILTALYTIGRVFTRTSGDSDRKGSGYLMIIGVISLVFYYVGTYILLYLSRTREYWADEYSKEKTSSGNALASALVKIAYGIVSSSNSEKTKDLMEGTRTLGIFDHKNAKNFGLVGSDYVQNGDRNTVVSAMVYDFHNLWAFWLELSSSHPLTGKRIQALLAGEKKPLFDVAAAKNFAFDKNRHYKEFVTDWLVSKAGLLLGFVGFIAGLGTGSFGVALGLGLLIGGFGLLGAGLYRFPSVASRPNVSVDQLMADVYASPVRGKPCSLDGELIGRGVPGFALSEDFMFQDKTGLIYLDYQHAIPVLGDLFFAVSKAKALVGQKAAANGWFFRGFGQHVALDTLQAGGQTLKSRQKMLTLFFAGLLCALGLGLMLMG